MPIILVTNNMNIREHSADAIIEFCNLQNSQKDVFSDEVMQLLFDSMPYGNHAMQLKYTKLPCFISTLCNKNYKCIAQIFSQNKEKTIFSDKGDCEYTYWNLFEYMWHLNYKKVVLSLEQYKNFIGNEKFDICDFLSDMLENASFFEIEIEILADEKMIKDNMPKLKKSFGSEYIKSFDNNTIIYDHRCIELNKNNGYNDIKEAELDEYFKDCGKKNKFRNQLMNYIFKTNLPETTIADLANMSKTTLNKIKNGKRIPTRSCVLSLGIVLGLDAEQFVDFVQAAGFIFPKEDGTLEAQRDWCIKYLLNKDNIRQISIINKMLEKKGLELLGESKI